MVESIVDHQGKGVNGEFLIRWKAGDQTWAPYREVAHLMAMGRYCELMGVEDPRDLPAKRSTERQGGGKVSSSGIRVLVGRYKGSQDGGLLSFSSPMTHTQSHESLLACASYAQRWRDHSTGIGPPPTGPPPPGFDDYVHLMSLGRTTNQSFDMPTPPPARHNSPAVPGTAVTMPSDTFNHLVDSQVRLAQLSSGRGSAETPRYSNNQVTYRRGRGVFRGVYRNRGTRGRPIPGGLGNNRRSRPSNRLVEVPASSANVMPGGSRWGILGDASDPETISEAGSGVTFGSDTTLANLFGTNVVVSAGGVEAPALGSNGCFPFLGNADDPGPGVSGLANTSVDQWVGGQDTAMEEVGPVASGSGSATARDVDDAAGDGPAAEEGLGAPGNPGI